MTILELTHLALDYAKSNISYEEFLEVIKLPDDSFNHGLKQIYEMVKPISYFKKKPYTKFTFYHKDMLIQSRYETLLYIANANIPFYPDIHSIPYTITLRDEDIVLFKIGAPEIRLI